MDDYNELGPMGDSDMEGHPIQHQVMDMDGQDATDPHFQTFEEQPMQEGNSPTASANKIGQTNSVILEEVSQEAHSMAGSVAHQSQQSSVDGVANMKHSQGSFLSANAPAQHQ